MKKLLITYLLSALLALFQNVQAQDVGINILSVPSVIKVDSTAEIVVQICNLDADPIDVVANKLRPLISVSPIIQITGVTNDDGTALTGWSILTQSTSSIRLQNTASLVNGECFTYRVQVIGVSPGLNGPVTGTIGFNGPQTSGNLTANDNSTTGITVLPVTLVSFDVDKEGGLAQLKWATTEEINSDYFEVQHSVTGKEWAPVGEVSSHGESNSLKKYTFAHSAPLNGENLYRLKMVDKDQTFAYSRIRSVKFDGLTEVDLSVYPNPVVDQLNIRDISGVAQINIYDLKGVSLYQAVNPKTAEINVKDLHAGMYIVKIQRANGLSSSQKIVVNK